MASIQSSELKNILLQLRNERETGYVSVSVRKGIKTLKGSLKVLKGEIVGVEYDKESGQAALEKLGAAQKVKVSFADNKTASSNAVNRKSEKQSGFAMNVRTKMLLLFSVLPTLILAGLGFFYISQLNTMSNLITSQGKAIVTNLAEQSIRDQATSVASQMERFLRDNPELTEAEFATNPEFQAIGVQPVGETGYTVLLEAPFQSGDLNHVWHAHPNTALINQSLGSLEEALGDNFAGVNGVISGVVPNGGRTEGYYAWLDADGEIRDKFLATERIGDTSYYVASTTYMNEFTQPMITLEQNSTDIVKRTQLFVILGIVLAILFMIIVVFVYGNRLSSKIQKVSNIAERISMGELDMKIEGTEAKDELGALARAVERLRLSVQVMLRELNAN